MNKIKAYQVMADVFEQHINEDHTALSVDGFNQLKAIFGNVLETERASVYIDFVNELQRRGHKEINCFADNSTSSKVE